MTPSAESNRITGFFFRSREVDTEKLQQLMKEVREWEQQNPQRHLINERVVITEEKPDLLKLAQSPAVVAMSHPIPPGH